MGYLYDMSAAAKQLARHGKRIKGTTNYTNRDSPERVLRYITRTRRKEKPEKREELVCWGSVNTACDPANNDIDSAVKQIKDIQGFYHIENRGGRRMFHETFRISDREFDEIGRDFGKLETIARWICNDYDDRGFQTVYAIHQALDENSNSGNRGIHIHIAGNSVNYRNGKKWHTNFEDRNNRSEYYSSLFGDSKLHGIRKSTKVGDLSEILRSDVMEHSESVENTNNHEMKGGIKPW